MALTTAERDRVKLQFVDFDKIDSDRRSPMYVAISRHMARNTDLFDVFEGIPEDQRRPVLLFAAVHYLVLRGDGEGLTRIYEAAEDRRAIEEAGPAFERFLGDWSDEIAAIMSERSVQTNEVNRCIALLPALMTVYRERRRPLALVELGSSAGLNLLFDRYRYDYAGGQVIGPPGATVRLATQLRGRVPRMDPVAPPVEFRVGLDLDPVDINDDDAILWLRACIWVGDVARDQRLTAAVSLARREWPEVRQQDAVSGLSATISSISDDFDLCVFSSWMLSWLTRPDRESIVETLRDIGSNRNVWLITFEDSGNVPGLQTPEGHEVGQSVLGLQHFGPAGGNSRVLATAHSHGNWLDWVDSATAAW